MKETDFIPCLFLRGSSNKVLIHFHANGEDMGSAYGLLVNINMEFQFNVVCVEYPDYGIYKGNEDL